jgi:hypothetical protein
MVVLVAYGGDMGSINDAVEALNNLLSMPAVRICALAVSLASLLVSLWALRKTNLAVRTFRSNVLAEHARFIESQWVSIYQLTLVNDKFAAYVAEMFDLGSVETAQREASLLMYINVLAMTISSWQNKVIDNATYKSHMESFFGTYRGDKQRLTELIGLVGYDDKFRAACKGYLERSS